MEKRRRVVITGMGVVAPNGIGIENFWDSLVHGRSAVRKITHFDASSYPSQIAAEVPDFDPTDYMDYKSVKRLGRFAQFALAASQMAIEDSGLDCDKENPYRIGVFIGTAIGGGDVSESQHSVFIEKGLKRISPYAAVSISTHSASGVISCVFNLKGPNTTVSSGCNSGLDASYLAYNAIRMGDADVVIVGAGEAPITPYIYAIFCASGFLSRENREPKKALKPYDINADGMVLGEGGATIILEELQHALKRSAKIYGEVLGCSAANEAFDLFGIETDNGAMANNLRQVLNNANIDGKAIDYINAHGNGLLPYDVSETEAIKKVFGELAYNIPVTSIKPITGHSISSTGIFQIISSLLAIKEGIIPPTINLENPDPKCDLNYVPNRFLKKKVQTSIINGHGFGGRLTALIVEKFFIDKTIS
jgi:3-oxoacyl-[acyl-carrier-protein] synthase II